MNNEQLNKIFKHLLLENLNDKKNTDMIMNLATHIAKQRDQLKITKSYIDDIALIYTITSSIIKTENIDLEKNYTTSYGKL